MHRPHSLAAGTLTPTEAAIMPAPTMKSITNSPSLQHQNSSGECGIEPALGGISANAQTSQSCCRNANPYRGCDHPAPTMKSITNSPSLQHQDSSGECGIEPALGGIRGGVNLILPHSGSQKRQNWDEVK